MKCYIIFERDRWSLSSFNMHACIVDHRVLDAPADGNHVRLNAVVRWFGECANQADIVPIAKHDQCRHICASLALRSMHRDSRDNRSLWNADDNRTTVQCPYICINVIVISITVMVLDQKRQPTIFRIFATNWLDARCTIAWQMKREVRGERASAGICVCALRQQHWIESDTSEYERIDMRAGAHWLIDKLGLSINITPQHTHTDCPSVHFTFCCI